MAAQPPPKVWIIDDDQSIRWVLEKTLQRAGIPARPFADASQALDALAEDPPAVALTDIRMPGMDGLSLLERLHDARPGLPVLVMTAYSDLDSAVSSYRSGAFEYLPKPFDIDEALAAVRRALAQSEPAEAAAPTPLAPAGRLSARPRPCRKCSEPSAVSPIPTTGCSSTGRPVPARS